MRHELDREGRAPSGNVPAGFIAPGGVVGQMKRPPRTPAVPLEWLKQQPTTRPWWADSIRTSVAAADIVELALQLEGGFEGVVEWMMLIGHSSPSNAVSGTGTSWRAFINEASVIQTRMQHSGSVNEDGRFYMLEHYDGVGTTWGNVQIWLPEQAEFSMSMNNNGGTSHPMGWMVRGYYWPIELRQEWVVRGWGRR
jgi:hypothetical protein